jgi:1-acyl-sn-glycerol-3-phosphate acyltransferase
MIYVLFAITHFVGQHAVMTAMIGFTIGAYAAIQINSNVYYRDYKDTSLLFIPKLIQSALFIIMVLASLLNNFYQGIYESPAVRFSSAVTLIVFGFALIIYSWRRLFRFTFEIFIECLTRIGYRIRARGPGVASFPRGPVVVIANHACWWDPLFLAGVVPRPITPMMTASFFDIWFLKPIMKHALGVIRVPEVAARREAPEIAEAVAALDNGECVVIFPESYLRRKDEVPLRRFARGVHQILKARPDTPVVACWIEGAWGSWCSWKGGRPGKGKPVDFRRSIEVGMSAAVTVPMEMLNHHLKTRIHLMNLVSQARTHVKMEPLPEFTLPAHEHHEPHEEDDS